MIKLDNVSKFYTSEEAVAIGLNKVNVELNIGEFVAVTGESGSGKSTFLNVISGIDSYEDGEMTVNGEETSGFLQSDWEKYRNDYISFVFQDYNIIDSYTVYQNVEIALLSRFPDKKERKKQALALIDEVGLSSHVKHKGTELSGGQKQRVVIARALAKDSPIIMADEPTGNLDSNTGKEIMALLAKMSKDRLVIVVTHNYEQVADYATRKLRFFDGEIVEDVKVKPYEESELKVTRLPEVKAVKRAQNVLGIAVNNVFATPKKLVFVAALFLLCSFALLFSVTMFTTAQEFQGGRNSVVFANTDVDRLIIKRGDDGAFTEADKQYIQDIAGEDKVVYKDLMIDAVYGLQGEPYESEYGYEMSDVFYGFGLPYSMYDGKPIKGRLPEADDEVFLAVDDTMFESAENVFGKTIGNYRWDEKGQVPVGTAYKVVGYGLNSDSGNLMAMYDSRMYFTEKGWEDVFLSTRVNGYVSPLIDVSLLTPAQKDILAAALNTTVEWLASENNSIRLNINSDDTLERGQIKVMPALSALKDTSVTAYYKTPFSKNSKTFTVVGTAAAENGYYNSYSVWMNAADIMDFLYPDDTYYQASVFVDEKQQDKVIEAASADGYYIARAYAAMEMDSMLSIIKAIYLGLFAILVFVLYLILSRVMRNIILSKKKDYVIMRSIGIEKKNINFVLLLELALVAVACFMVATVATLILRTSGIAFFADLLQLKFVHYMIVLLGLLALVTLMTRKFCRNMFGETVKNSLKNKA